MVSAVEQLARNADWGALAKASELKQRLLFVICALLVYRLGTYIPLPGIDPHVWNEIFTQRGGGILDMFNMFSGGGFVTYDDFCPEHHPLYFGLDYHATGDSHVSQAGSPEERGRGGTRKD